MATLAVFLAASGASILTRWNVPLPQCAFKSVTGRPCLTCGTTRALAAIGRLEIGEALRLNPAATLIFLATPVWLVVAFSRRNIDPARRRIPLPGRRSIIVAAVAAGVGNWIYLLVTLP